MSILVQTLPTDLGGPKYPQSHKFHKRGNKLTHSKTYPRGVSSYLTTFLNDDGGARNPESDSDSDESFYSYSARLHVENDQHSHRSTLSDKVQPPRSDIYTIKPVRHASGRQKKHDPTYTQLSFPASERRNLKQAEFGRKHSRRESVSRRRPGIRKRSLPSSHDPEPTISKKDGIDVEFVSDDSSDNESFRKHQRPRTADASAQTDDWQELSTSLYRLCRCGLSEESANSAPAQFAEKTGMKLPLESVHADQSATPVDANLPSPEIGHDRQSETPSSKYQEAIALEHGFAHSEELPGDVERLFDRTSFSIQGGSSGTGSMSSIADPDGLRNGLNALLDGKPISGTGTISDYGLLNPLPVKSFPPPQITLTTTNDPVSDLATSSPLKSISGILFADPFNSPPPASPQTNLSSTQSRKAPRSRTEAAYKRISSLQPPNRDIPPVPVIPAVFRESLYDRPASAINSHTKPSTSEESLVAADESEVGSPNCVTRQQLVTENDNGSTSEQLPPGISMACLNRSTDSLDMSANVSCYPAQTCYGAPRSGRESSGVMSIIHPHSPIQVTSVFPTTAQRTHSLIHVAAEGTERIRQPSRKSTSSVVDPQLKEYVERRLQAPKDLSSTLKVAATSSSPRRRSSVWTRLLGMDSSRPTMAPTGSAHEMLPVARRKLQRKQRL